MAVKGDGILFKRNLVVALFMACIFSFLQISHASAAPQLEVKAEAGINNKIKYYTPLPLKIEITNNGSAFSGDLVIDVPESYSFGSASIYPIDLAEGETKTIEVYLNGLSDDYLYSGNQPDMFYFYEGGVEEGKVVDYTGTKNVRPQYFEQEATFIYTLTENSDRLSAFLRLGQDAPYSVEIFHLNQLKGFNFPSDVKGLEMADMLVVDEHNLTDFSEGEQQAIYNWVMQGGTLLVGASDQVEASVGSFKQYLPLTLSTERINVSAESLKELSDGGIFTQGIDVYQAEEKQGSIRLLAVDDTVLASAKTIGKGRIIQTTFSLGDQPLASMDGYGKLLSKLFNLNAMSTTVYHPYDNEYMKMEIASVNELFPSFEVSATILIVIIIIYILIIGPILYFILKKMDKREHAWWLIPVVSIGLSICLFIFGAKDRLMQSQIQQSAFYKVNEDKSLTGHYVESILTSQSGDFVFTTDEQTTAVASRNTNGMGGNVGRIHEKSYVEQHANGSTITLKNLNYWSVQSVVGETTIQDAGNLDVQLTLKDGRLEGTVKNNFPFKLNDVAVWSGTREFELGDIEANKTLQVSQEVKVSVLLAPASANYYSYTTPRTKEELLPTRIEKLKNGASTLIGEERKPAIIAWADEALVGIELDGSAEVSPVSYFIQTFEPKVELSGGITLNKDTLEETLEPKSPYGYMDLVNPATNEWYLDEGDYDYYVSIPTDLLDNDIQWNGITVANKNAAQMELAIWNQETSTYEDITEQKMTITEGIESYLSEDGQVRVLIRYKDNGTGMQVYLPDVELEGVAQ